MNPKSQRNRGRAGMTLIEMLLVIALIALVAGLAIVQVGGVLEGNQEDIAGLFVKTTIETPLTSYKIHMGSYPSSAQGLRALFESPEGASGRWRGPYVKDLPMDPWQKPYQYRYPGTHNPKGYDVYSFGPDGIESADDIGNW